MSKTLGKFISIPRCLVRKLAFTCFSLFLLAAAFCITPSTVHAVPGFARSQQISCTTCHTVWPQLSEEGRDFKENGFEFGEKLQIDEDIVLEKNLPISARVNFRFVDKRTSKRKATGALTDKDKQLKLRALHEVEVFIAGRVSDEFSYFVEFEAEDEIGPGDGGFGFGIQVATGAMQYKIHDRLMVAAGYASPFYQDAYNTLNHHKNTRHRWAPYTKGFLPGVSQFISVAARPIDEVFLLAAYHANAGKNEGNDAEDISLRAMIDLVPNFSLGGYMNLEKTYDSVRAISQGEKLSLGIDFQANHENLNVHGLFAILEDRAADTQETTFGVEANYLQDVNNIAIGPIVSISSYTENDGDDTFVVGGFFATLRFLNNARVQVGWEGDLSVPDAIAHKESRLTLVGDVGF